MRKFLALSGFVMLSLGTVQADEQRPVAYQILDKAISRVRLCDNHTTTEIDLDKKGNPKSEPEDDQSANTRVDRFLHVAMSHGSKQNLESDVLNRVENGRPVWVIKFLPTPANLQAQSLDEDGDYNKIMNNMKGFVIVDKVTGELIHSEAVLVKKLSFKMKFAHLDYLKVSVDQRLVGDRWIPSQVEITGGGWIGYFIGPSFYQRYTTHFQCITEKQ